MRVELQLFAVARQRAGRAAVALDLPEGARVADLKRVLAGTHPELAPLVPNLLFAIDADYAGDDDPIPPGAAVAAIPPVSGGAPRRPQRAATGSGRRRRLPPARDGDSPR